MDLILRLTRDLHLTLFETNEVSLQQCKTVNALIQINGDGHSALVIKN